MILLSAGLALAEAGSALNVESHVTPTRSQVYPNADSVRPLEIGAMVPSVDVRSIDGVKVDVATLTKERGALLVFYRGGW
jgi:hypothetical protein